MLTILLSVAVVFISTLASGCGKKDVGSEVEDSDPRLTEVRSRVESIRTWAVVCKGEASKNDCDQGDNTLWNGLLCASGEGWACDAVKAMQEPEGWVRRSGSRRGNSIEINPTSRDMALGFALYVQARQDRAAAERLLAYVKSTGRLGPRCDDRCIATPLILNALRVAGGIGTGQVADHVFVLQNARGAPAGYPRHLAMIQVWLRKRAGWNGALLSEAASVLSKREPQNPFFAYVSGERETAVVQWLAQAPTKPPPETTQWSFERADADEAWRKSLGWDFVFLANLIAK